jgi:hypothetical protein
MEKNDSSKFLAIAWNRWIAILLLGTISLIYAQIFTVAFLSEGIIGNWLFLGGPSLWWATNALNMLALIYLILYSFLTMKKCTITLGDALIMHEKHLWRTEITTIPKESILAISLHTSRIGGRNGWIIFFVLQIWYLIVDGLAWVCNPDAFGFGLLTGWAYIIQAFVDLIALVLLVGFPPIECKITTLNDIFTGTIPGMHPKYYTRLCELFSRIPGEWKKIPEKTGGNIQKIRLYFVLGLCALIIGIIGRSLRIFVSDPLSISLCMTTGILILNAYTLVETNQYPRLNFHILSLNKSQQEILPNLYNKTPYLIWNLLILCNLGFWIIFGFYSAIYFAPM